MLKLTEISVFYYSHYTGILEGHTTCSPGYKIHNLQGELMLNGTSDTLFCPFDSKQKSIHIKDSNEDCIFQIKFTPSICECDSEVRSNNCCGVHWQNSSSILKTSSFPRSVQNPFVFLWCPPLMNSFRPTTTIYCLISFSMFTHHTLKVCNNFNLKCTSWYS